MIGKHTVSALVATGSNFSWLSEQWFLDNRDSIGKYEEVSITNIHIHTSVGAKTRKVSCIVMLKVKLNDEEI